MRRLQHQFRHVPHQPAAPGRPEPDHAVRATTRSVRPHRWHRRFATPPALNRLGA